METRAVRARRSGRDFGCVFDRVAHACGRARVESEIRHSAGCARAGAGGGDARGISRRARTQALGVDAKDRVYGGRSAKKVTNSAHG